LVQSWVVAIQLLLGNVSPGRDTRADCPGRGDMDMHLYSIDIICMVQDKKRECLLEDALPFM
jgi:hypothetical protein